MLAAAGRLREKPSWRMSAIVGLGAGLLTISRPYEGLIFCVGIGLLLMRRSILRVAWAGGIVLAIALAFNGWRNYAITGNPLLLPYSLYERQYDPVPNFIWETARPVPHYRNPELADIYVNWYLAYYNRVHAPGGMLRLVGAKIKDIRNELVGLEHIPYPRSVFFLLVHPLYPSLVAAPH